MLQKIKDRNKVLILSKEKEIENDIFMVLSSHGYSIDLICDVEEARDKLIYYKPELFIADINLLPDYPAKLLAIFTKARKTPTFLIIDDEKSKEKLSKYLECCNDVLKIPFNEENLYYKIRKAVNYSKIIGDNQYYEGMFLILKLMAPLLVLMVFLITVV